MRFSEHRRSYTLGGLRRKDLAADPVAQFIGWQEQAITAGLADPTAPHLIWGSIFSPRKRTFMLLKPAK